MTSAGYEYTRPWLYPKQLEAIFCKERYGVIEACTKTGKTSGCLVWLFELAALTGRAGRNYWWVAPVHPQAAIAFRRLPLMLGDRRDILKVSLAEKTYTLPNGAVIWFKSAETPDNLYGEDVYGAVIDEATRVRAESWHAIRSTLTKTKAPIRIIGNVKGRKNWAYQLARKAEGGASGFHYARLVAADGVEAGILDAEEIADAKENLPPAVFAELYEATPSDDSGCPFGTADLAICTVKDLSTKAPVAWGWDLAKSQDWTAGIALDADGAVCRFVRFQSPWELTRSRMLQETGRVPAWVDSTGVGDPIVEELQGQAGYRFYGFKFHQNSKQQLMEGLSAGIQSGGLKFPEGVIVSELSCFEYAYTRTGVRYSAPSGQHDDCVCALALAYHGFKTGAGRAAENVGRVIHSKLRR